MKFTIAEKPKLYLVGPPKEGLPTLEDLVKLFKQVTGREPTAQDIQEAQEVLAKK